MNDYEKQSTFFRGTFDGGGHTISNLTFEMDSFIVGAGLFGVNSGTIKNLNVADSLVHVTHVAEPEKKLTAIGGVIGYNMGTVENVALTGSSSILGNNCVGGVIGGNEYGAVSGCRTEGAVVELIGDNSFPDRIIQCDIAMVGGLIIGDGFGGTIDGCSVKIDIDAKDATHVGGLVGTGLYDYGQETALKITNCSVSGTIDGAVTPGTILGRSNADSSYDEATRANVKVLIDGKASGAEVGTTDRMYESADQDE